MLYIIGACQGGHHSNGRDTYGHSLIVDPLGLLISEKTDMDPGIIYANIDLNHLKQIRKSIPTREQQKIFFDISKLKA
ncbi:MAG: nitrilase-related carbon-nitrogen hydrolase [Rickettsiella sp.]|nr:nitrilase-related carbon-nitrogen hydrolase [Rickettsiella sp.]